jgi:hypothetical protein
MSPAGTDVTATPVTHVDVNTATSPAWTVGIVRFRVATLPKFDACPTNTGTAGGTTDVADPPRVIDPAAVTGAFAAALPPRVREPLGESVAAPAAVPLRVNEPVADGAGASFAV